MVNRVRQTTRDWHGGATRAFEGYRGRAGRLVGLLIALCLPLSFLTASGASATNKASPARTRSGKTITIGYATPALVGGQGDILKGFVHWATTMHWKVVTLNDNGDPATQVTNIKDFIARGVNAIVAVPDSSTGICAGVAAAHAAHVPIFTIDRGTIGCRVDMTVESNNTLGGQQAGTAMVQLLTRRYGSPTGTVLEITGDLSQNVAIERGAGFASVLRKYPHIHLIVKDGNWDAATGTTIVRDVVSAYPHLDGIYLQSDDVYIAGTLAALGQLHRLFKVGQPGHIIITSVDGSPAGVQAIRAGWSDMAAAQPIPDDGVIVKWIQKVLNGQRITPGVVYLKGALWSPGTITNRPNGFHLLLATTIVTVKNANNPGLWANEE